MAADQQGSAPKITSLLNEVLTMLIQTAQLNNNKLIQTASSTTTSKSKQPS